VTGQLDQALAAAASLPGGRSRCVQEGYASLALLPLRRGLEVVGLLQLNARAPNRFDDQLIQFLEEVGAGLGLAVERRRAEEALRVSEERYRVLVETSPDGVALLDHRGNLLMANRRLALLLGVEDAVQLSGHPLTEFVAEEDRRRAEAALGGRLGDGAPDAPFRFRLGDEAFDGEIKAAVLDPDGGAAGAQVVVVRDVTEQRKLRARLAQADRMASVGMLAAGVAHEINNPLTYVLANLEGLAAELRVREAQRPAADGRDDLEALARDALDGAQRIRKIVRDLMVFSGTTSDRLEPVSLNQVIEGAINMSRGEVKYRARLVTELGATPPVQGNEGRLAQVFLNLLVNAAQAIPEGDAEHHRITVRTWAEPGAVLAEVTDTGAGIPADVLPRIYEPFFTTKSTGVGTGLGLAISRRIIEEAGGRITAESRPGEGARFLVRLPAAPAGPPVSPPPLDVASTVGGSRRGRVLIVDDEPLIRSSLARLLRREHDVVEAPGGRAAEAMLTSDESFDVILCDLIMPEMSGMELHTRLASTRPHLVDRMVFMSGGAFTERAAEFLHAAPRMVEKPVEVARLCNLVREMVDARTR
jgi:PAS domain S-box-containing protein